ncbi:TonB-dependent receptor [soil metagenome]
MQQHFFHHRMTRLALAISAALVPALMPIGAFAQSAVSGATTVAPNSQLETVIVTTEKRDTDQQKTSASVTAVGEAQLDRQNITEINGLNAIVPGFVAAKAGGGERTIAIRGVGSETPSNGNTQPGVAFHVDGVYLFNSIAFNSAFIDTARVEVLRGPQGTLFGQSSTGGTVNVITNQPTLGEWTGFGQVGVGNYNATKASAALNVPIGDTMALRIAAQKYTHDGYAYAVGTQSPHELDDQDERGAKIGFLWSPITGFNVSLNWLHYYGKNGSQAQKNIFDTQSSPRILSQDYPGKSDIESNVYYAIMSYDLPFARIKSTTAFQSLNSLQSWDSDGLDRATFLRTAGAGYDVVNGWDQDVYSWSQELSLSSLGDGPLSYTGGVLLSRSKNIQYIVEFKGSDINPVFTKPPKTGPRPYNLSYANDQTSTRKSYAPFAQFTYAVIPSLRGIAGIRYNHDEYQGAAGSYFAPVTKSPKVSGGEMTGKLGVEYDITAQNMVYATWTRGYKPGGQNLGSGSAITVPLTFNPEKVDAYEIGSKNRFMDNKLQANFAAFNYNYKDMQYIQDDPFPFADGLSNIPKTRIQGLEAEGAYIATNQLRFDGNVSYLKGEIRSSYTAYDAYALGQAQSAICASQGACNQFDPRVIAARLAAGQDVKGNPVPKLPKWGGTISATYTQPLDSWGTLTVRPQWEYRGKYTYRVFNVGSLDQVPSYNLWNLWIGYQPNIEHWSFSLSATNLTDRDGVNSRFTDPYGSSVTSNTYIPPRQFLVSARYDF